MGSKHKFGHSLSSGSKLRNAGKSGYTRKSGKSGKSGDTREIRGNPGTLYVLGEIRGHYTFLGNPGTLYVFPNPNPGTLYVFPGDGLPAAKPPRTPDPPLQGEVPRRGGGVSASPLPRQKKEEGRGRPFLSTFRGTPESSVWPWPEGHD